MRAAALGITLLAALVAVVGVTSVAGIAAGAALSGGARPAGPAGLTSFTSLEVARPAAGAQPASPGSLPQEQSGSAATMALLAVEGAAAGEAAQAATAAADEPMGEVAAPPDAPAAAPGPGPTSVDRSAPVRIPKPAVPPGPRRVGLQAGHWLTQQVPDELRRLEHSTGATWRGVPEWQVNLAIAERVAAILRGHGYQVDVLPTTLPAGYLADVFVALHADGATDGGVSRGYKAAHGARRGPYEDHLVQALMEEYGRATGLPVDPKVTRNMLGYYAFSWSRFSSTVAPHTPAAILEMGFLTNAADRTLLLDRQDVVATGVANGILRFLADVPAGAAFAEDLVVPPSRPPGAPTPGPR